MSRSFLSLIASIALSQSAMAQTAPAADDKPIVVEGRTAPKVRSYVDRVARAEPGYQIARWNRPPCITYDGLDDHVVRFIQARIATIAQGVSLKLATPKCRADALIMLTDRADALTEALLHRPFRPNGNITRSDALRTPQTAALQQPRTVRWLTATLTFGQNGRPIFESTNRIWSASIIQSATRESVEGKLVLIDKARLSAVTLRQLADYLTFVMLASPDIAADYTDTDSIMALFAGGERSPPKGLTQQDCLLLDALYAIAPDLPADRQAAAIRGYILKGKSRLVCNAN